MNREEILTLYIEAKDGFLVSDAQMEREFKLMGGVITRKYIGQLHINKQVLYQEKLDHFGKYLKRLLAYKRALKKVGDNAKANV